MRKIARFFYNIIAAQCVLVILVRANVQEKAEATIPIPSRSPPEGNTTFLDGTTWCVARSDVSPTDLKIALDWACGFGKADCHPIQSDGPCFHPDTLHSHASYAFNSYYQQNGNSDIACYFGGTAALTQTNPSYERCEFVASGLYKTSAASSSKYWVNEIWWKIEVILLIFLHYI